MTPVPFRIYWYRKVYRARLAVHALIFKDTVPVKIVNGFKTKLEKERSKKMGLFLN